MVIFDITTSLFSLSLSNVTRFYAVEAMKFLAHLRFYGCTQQTVTITVASLSVPLLLEFPSSKKMNMFNMERGVFEAYAQWIDFEEGEKNSLIVIDSVKKRREKIDHTNQSCGNFIREKRYFATAVYINMVLFIQPGFLCCLHICFFFIIFLLLLLLPDSSERKWQYRRV